MKYKKFFIVSIVTIICILLCRKFYAYYSPAQEREIYYTIQHNDDTLRIAFIGDSWAFGHQHHYCLIPQMLSENLQRPVIVESYGIGGLTSKEIYHALFEIDTFKNFIIKGYDYCIISAGINDTNKKMSISYYKNSINCIIRFMHENHIHPILLEIPDYNILQTYNNHKFYEKTVRRLSMIINSKDIDCKQEFREALNDLINENRYEDQVSIIRYRTWNNNYTKDLETLYIDDQVHLNERGYQKLDSVVTNIISKHYLREKRQKVQHSLYNK